MLVVLLVLPVGSTAADNRCSQHRQVESGGRRRSSSAGTGRRSRGAGPRLPGAGGGNARLGPPKTTGSLEVSCEGPLQRPLGPVRISHCAFVRELLKLVPVWFPADAATQLHYIHHVS